MRDLENSAAMAIYGLFHIPRPSHSATKHFATPCIVLAVTICVGHTKHYGAFSVHQFCQTLHARHEIFDRWVGQTKSGKFWIFYNGRRAILDTPD